MITHGRTRRRLVVGLLAFTLPAAALVGGSAGSAVAGPGGACSPALQLKAVTINQGLGSYARLVRGKQTLVRGYFGLSCGTDVGASIEVQNASLTVKNGTTPLNPSGIAAYGYPLGTVPANPTANPPIVGNYPLVTTSGSPTAPDAAADVKFLVPGSTLSIPSTQTYTPSFEISVTYRTSARAGAGYSTLQTTVFTTLTGSTAKILKPVEKRTNALRVLAVPMGFPLSQAGNAALQSGMGALSRMFPVADGTSADILSTSGGLRYGLNLAPIDLGALNLLDANRMFCGTSGNFPTVKSELAKVRASWNAANSAKTTLGAAMTATQSTLTVPSTTTGFPTVTPFKIQIENELLSVTAVNSATATWTVTRGIDGTAAATHASGKDVVWGYPADRVVGVVNADNSLPSGTGGCAEGMGSIGGPEAWVRAVPGKTGGLLGMELCHTFSCVPPSTRSDGGYHSLYANADWATGDADRGYNVPTATLLGDDRNVMKYPDTTAGVSGWTDSNTLLDSGDYGYLLCKLGGTTTTDCTTTGTTGTTQGVAATLPTDTFTITGATDGTKSTTEINQSFESLSIPTETGTGTYQVVQKNGAGAILATDFVPVSFDDSIHSQGSGEDLHNADGTFSVSVPLTAAATVLELWKGAPTESCASSTDCLYSTDKSQPPTVSPSSGDDVGPPGTGSITPTTDASDLATALASNAGDVTGATFDSVPPSGTPNGTSNEALAGFPTNGSNFAILTTGDVQLADDANDSGSSGANDGGGAVRGSNERDATILKINLAVPSGANCLSFDFKFLSEEYPEWVGRGYNDAFIAELDPTSPWTTSATAISAPNNFAYDQNGNPITVDSTGRTAVSSDEAAGTTYDAATPLLRASTAVSPGNHVLYLSIFDQGDNIYDSAVFVDNLVVGTGDAGCGGGATPIAQRVSATATDDGSGSNLSADLLLAIPNGPRTVIASDLSPTSSEGHTATFSFTADVGCPGCTYDMVVRNQWASSPVVTVEESALDTTQEKPVAAIGGPAVVYVRQWDGLTLKGSGEDAQDGEVKNLAWSATPSLFSGTQTGKTLQVAAPIAPNTYTVTLTATDVDGNTDTDSVTVHVLHDVDHDNLPAGVDPGSCSPFYTAADHDAFNFGKDADGDGLPNYSDVFTGASGLTASNGGANCQVTSSTDGTAGFTPATFVLPPAQPATTGSVAFTGVSVPFRDLRQVSPSSVKITAINGQPLSTAVVNAGWAVSATVASAKFNAADLSAYFNNHPELWNRSVLLELSGSAPAAGTRPAWSFTVRASTYVKTS